MSTFDSSGLLPKRYGHSKEVRHALNSGDDVIGFGGRLLFMR